MIPRYISPLLSSHASNMDSTPLTSPIRRPILLNKHSSPLNPNANDIPHAIAIPRRLSGTNAGIPRSPTSPTRFLARTPLSFLSSSPSKSRASRTSTMTSSIAWQLQTPPADPNPGSHLALPSPKSLAPADLITTSNTGSAAHVSTRPLVKIPLVDATDPNHLMGTGPSPLRHKMVYLQSLPPSPPIVIPSAQLLELSPGGRANADDQHSIASPFVNLVSTASPVCPVHGPPVTLPFADSRRSCLQRRQSSLSRELDSLHLADSSNPTRDGTTSNHDADVSEPNLMFTVYIRPDHSSP